MWQWQEPSQHIIAELVFAPVRPMHSIPYGAKFSRSIILALFADGFSTAKITLHENLSLPLYLQGYTRPLRSAHKAHNIASDLFRYYRGELYSAEQETVACLLTQIEEGMV